MSKLLVVPVSLIGATMISLSLQAQAPVEDRSTPAGSRAASANQSQTSLSQDASLQLFDELQTLRQEVTRLRGMIEELSYQLQQLEERQTNDYANLDRRILEMSDGGGANESGTSASATAGTPASNNATPPAANSNSGQAAEMYNQAFASLRSGDREAAISQFESLVNQYPDDSVAGDALYWLGETHWVSAGYEDARSAFVMLTDRFSDHRRYGDALYKLGLIYHQLGNEAEARSYLQQAVELGGDVGARAEEFLTQNLSP